MKNLVNAMRCYVSLGSEDIRVVEHLFEKIYLEKEEFLKCPNCTCRHFTFVKQGLLRHYINNEGEESTIYFSAENEFACDFDSFLSNSPTPKGIVAIEPTTLFSISYEKLQQLYDNVKFGDRFGRLLIEAEFTKTVKHIISVHTDSAEQRYKNFLSTFKHISQRIPQYYIASFIGVTPSSLSRIRRNSTL